MKKEIIKFDDYILENKLKSYLFFHFQNSLENKVNKKLKNEIKINWKEEKREIKKSYENMQN